jgi:hypothetical protein
MYNKGIEVSMKGWPLSPPPGLSLPNLSDFNWVSPFCNFIKRPI